MGPKNIASTKNLGKWRREGTSRYNLKKICSDTTSAALATPSSPQFIRSCREALGDLSIADQVLYRETENVVRPAGSLPCHQQPAKSAIMDFDVS